VWVVRLETKAEESSAVLLAVVCGGVVCGPRAVYLLVSVQVSFDAADAGHHVSHADLAATDLLPQVARFQRLRQRLAELQTAVDRRQPEAKSRGVVVARASAVAFDERWSSERLEAWTRRVQRLTRTIRSSARVLRHDTLSQWSNTFADSMIYIDFTVLSFHSISLFTFNSSFTVQSPKMPTYKRPLHNKSATSKHAQKTASQRLLNSSMSYLLHISYLFIEYEPVKKDTKPRISNVCSNIQQSYCHRQTILSNWRSYDRLLKTREYT